MKTLLYSILVVFIKILQLFDCTFLYNKSPLLFQVMIAVCSPIRLPQVNVYEESEVVLTSEYHLLMLQLDAQDVAIGLITFQGNLIE